MTKCRDCGKEIEKYSGRCQQCKAVKKMISIEEAEKRAERKKLFDLTSSRFDVRFCG